MAKIVGQNYQMKPCRPCGGAGRGVFASGARWTCDNCGGAGKVSKFPPAKNNWFGFKSAMNENGWTP